MNGSPQGTCRNDDGAQLAGAAAARELHLSRAQRNGAAVGSVASVGAVATCSSARQLAWRFARQLEWEFARFLELGVSGLWVGATAAFWLQLSCGAGVLGFLVVRCGPDGNRRLRRKQGRFVSVQSFWL